MFTEILPVSLAADFSALGSTSSSSSSPDSLSGELSIIYSQLNWLSQKCVEALPASSARSSNLCIIFLNL